MFVAVFIVNGKYSICNKLKDGNMDPDYCTIPDLEHKGTAQYIADRINEAYRRGAADKASEIRKVIGA